MYGAHLTAAEKKAMDIEIRCELADFQIEGRIVLIDKQTGRVWR